MIHLHRVILLAVPVAVFAQSPCRTKHLTIFDNNLAEFLEERTLDLQSGANSIEWRSLMPQTQVRTIRVTAGEGVTIVRQDLTFDGPEARGQKSPVLHLVIKNDRAPGPYKVQVDYLASGLSWKGDYALLLSQSRQEEMEIDGIVNIHNDTGADICAATADIVAGEVQLLSSGGGTSRTPIILTSQFGSKQLDPPGPAAPAANEVSTEVTSMTVFHRLRLGRNIAIAANVSIGRFPLFQRLKLPVEERHIFENEATAQTLGRGGFTLLPRGLEVRLVSRNQSKSPLPVGLVTIYSQDDEVPQVAGQDQIPLTPAAGDFSVSQGRSNRMQGTRRVVERKNVHDPSAYGSSKLVTQVETVIINRGSNPTNAFVREGVENYGREWTVTESTHPHQKLGDRMMEFRVLVPANGSVKVNYTVESR